MTINYTEKRDFIRLPTDSKVSYKIKGTKKSQLGKYINLSSTGVLFSGRHTISPGTALEINIIPTLSIVQPLIATAEVIRSQNHKDGGVEIAAQIILMQ